MCKKSIDGFKRRYLQGEWKKAEMNQYLPAAGADVLIAGTLTNIRFTAYLKEKGIDVSAIEGTWENYMIRTMEDDHGCLLIAGSDKRGQCGESMSLQSDFWGLILCTCGRIRIRYG